MSRFLSYDPEQAYLVPPSVRDVLGADHLCFFVHRLLQRVEMKQFYDAYASEGAPAYAPEMMLRVLLYAYALGVTSMRRLEQRIREDLAFRYLAGGQEPDFWALNQFRRRHARAINDVFTQVLGMARQRGLARLGKVAIDSTRIKANASRDRIEVERGRRAHDRRQVRRWQQQGEEEDPNEGAGMRVAHGAQAQEPAAVREALKPLPRPQRRSRTDADARFLRERGGRFVLGYTAEIAVSEDHLIVAQRVTQNANDVGALLPMVDEVERQCRRLPQRVLADSGFFSNGNVEGMRQRGVQAYIPDPNLAAELHGGSGAGDRIGRMVISHPESLRMRQRLRSPAGRAMYEHRKTLVESVFGTLKEQRGMRQFRRRGLAHVAVEWSLASTAFNITRLHRSR